MRAFDQGMQYRNIFILESRKYWENCKSLYDTQQDLVLTYDLGLKHEIEKEGGRVQYIDHLVDSQLMQENNFLVYQFFRDWHKDAQGNDIFEYRGIPFGFSFRLEIWNDLIFFARTRICLEALKKSKFEKIFAGTRLGQIEATLNEMGLPFTPVAENQDVSSSEYFFPIQRWMDEKVRYQGIGGIKYRVRDMVSSIQGTLLSWLDRLTGGNKPAIFLQEYHPTRKLVQRLQAESKVRLILATFSRTQGLFRYIPVWGSADKYQTDADKLIQKLRERRCTKLVLSNGVDISEGIFRIIEERIAARLTETLRNLECVIRYLDKNPIRLEVLIANIGQMATLVDCVCRSRGIPSYLIINGMMGSQFQDESKYASIINAYSTSIKNNYFRGMSNIICLGDPRMDTYAAKISSVRTINRKEPTITIGASGHNSTDLNSYLAIEFEFMFDVLEAIRVIKSRGVKLRTVIKVRANGYLAQYEAFVQEYFPGLVDEILDTGSMDQLLNKTDFFISIYSQTLFEASILGIPALYYKKDTEIKDPPFDGHSELVTVDNINDLIVAIDDFRTGHHRYDAFLERTVMEKYIGSLDGHNLQRNLDYIYELLEQGA